MSGGEGQRKAVFLDRDGTINVEKDYLYRAEDFEFIGGVSEAIKRFNDAGFLVIVVTNQSGVARGYYTPHDVDQLHAYIQDQLMAVGARVDAFYMCPHHPTQGQGAYLTECDCRKGSPGMLLQAAGEYNIDLSVSWIVGDKLADVEAGVRAGSRPVLVRTGYGETECKRLGDYTAITSVVDDLQAAADLILGCE